MRPPTVSAPLLRELDADLGQSRGQFGGGHLGGGRQQGGQGLAIEPELLERRAEDRRRAHGRGQGLKGPLRRREVDQAPAAQGDPRKQEGPRQSGQESSADQGALADATGAGDQQEPPAAVDIGLQATDQVPGLGLPADEDRLVAELEGPVHAKGAAPPILEVGGQAPLGADAAVEELAQLGLDQFAKGMIIAELAEGAPKAAIGVEEMGAEKGFETAAVRQGLPRRLGIVDVHQAGGGLAIDQHLRAAGARRGLHRVDEFPLGPGQTAIGVVGQGRPQARPKHDQHDLAVRGPHQPRLKALRRGQGLLLPQDRLHLEIGQILLGQGLDDAARQGPLMIQVGRRRDEDANQGIGHRHTCGRRRR